MSHLEVVRRCNICGAILQTEEEGALGYIEKEILERKRLDDVVACKRCYDENKFALAPEKAASSENFMRVLSDMKASDALIVYVIDAFSFECFFPKDVIEKIKRLPLLVVCNKRDLLPSISDKALAEYVAHRFRVAGLSVTSDDVLIMSLNRPSAEETKKAAKEIEERRKRHDVCVIGGAKTGKTMLCSNFLANYSNTSKREIVSETYPGTNLRILRIPLDGSSFLYDTPGIEFENSIRERLLTKDALLVHPNEPVKARRFTLEKGQSIVFGSLGRLELLDCEDKVRLSAYFSGEVPIKKLSSTGDKGQMEFLKILDSLVRPSFEQPLTLKDLDVFDIIVTETGVRDIGIAGLGWVSFPANGEKWRLYVPKGVGAYTSRAKIQ